MAQKSSPLPIRHSNAKPLTPSSRNTIHIDDDDELGGDTIPCSPAAFLRDTTQPTQIMSRPSLTNPRSSSPASVIEVPASSPFQPKKPTLGSRLAPAGTVFRPPPRQPPPPMVKKRPAPEPISLLSDDEDDLTPPRGDIRPTTFKKQIAAFAYKPEDDENRILERLRQLYDVFGDKYPSELARRALKQNRNDLDDTIEWLEKHYPNYDAGQLLSRPPPAVKAVAKPNGRRLVSKGSLQQAKKPTSRPITVENTPSPQPKPAKRRLIQGLRRRSSPSSSQVLPEPPSSDDPLVIDLVDNDQDDAYDAERSPSPVEDNDQVLNCVNTSTIKEMAAMTGMNEALLEHLVEKRPFADLAQARRVSIKKPSSRKSAKISIGETAVDAIEVFLNAVSAIDEVVAKCEKKGQAVKSVIDTWDLDTFGHDKRSTRPSPAAELPLTPTSLNGSKFVRPVIPQQPRMMDGHCEMKPFQLFGLNWMSVLYNYDIGCILADEMGLGKTCQVISLFCHLVEKYEESPTENRPWPNLVVVPPSTYNNWLAEFARFAPDLSVIGYRGSQSQRAEIAYEVENNPEDYHVVLATYSQINSEADVEAMASFDLNAAVFDEGHKMKNPETKVYNDLRRIPASWKMLLTGLSAEYPGRVNLLITIRNAYSEQSAGDDISLKLH